MQSHKSIDVKKITSKPSPQITNKSTSKNKYDKN